MLTPYTCPECSSPLEIHTDAEVEDQMWRAATYRIETFIRPATVAFCTGCEFAIELRPISVAGYNEEARS